MGALAKCGNFELNDDIENSLKTGKLLSFHPEEVMAFQWLGVLVLRGHKQGCTNEDKQLVGLLKTLLVV